jgi:glycosyltransferase involved in cell wall biosynthesis
MTIAFIIATKDRPDDLELLLKNLAGQSRSPDQLIIVDASRSPHEAITERYSSNFDLKYIRYQSTPSASAQRNAGVKAVNGRIDLIGFLDDDVLLEPDAIEAMLSFWQVAPDDLGGCAFNLKNFVPAGAEALKHSRLASWLGLYSKERGIVMPTGWQTMTGTVTKTLYVEWLPIGASVWRRKIFERFQFEEYFEGYSYLEDLDFSYSVSRHYGLAVVAEAGFYHYHSPSGRIRMYDFGKREVANRLFFVRKHGLSVPGCYLGLAVRLLMTLCSAVKGRDRKGVQRALGNCVGICRDLFFERRRSCGGAARA